MASGDAVRARVRRRICGGGGLAFSVTTAVGFAVLVAGCGGGGKAPAVANLGTTTSSPAATTSPSASGAAAADGGGGGQVATGGAGTGFGIAMAGDRTEMMKLTTCMRAHGIADFPVPDSQGVIQIGSSSGIDEHSPQFQKAMTDCRKLMPGGNPTPAEQAQARAQAVKFSQCMRTHGVPNFPDPTFGSGGRVALKISSSTGIDPQSPTFQAAQKACGSLAGGKFGPPTAAPGGGAGG